MPLQRYSEERNGVQYNPEGKLVKHEHVLELLFEILEAVGANGSNLTSEDYIIARTDAEATILHYLEEENGGETY